MASIVSPRRVAMAAMVGAPARRQRVASGAVAPREPQLARPGAVAARVEAADQEAAAVILRAPVARRAQREQAERVALPESDARAPSSSAKTSRTEPKAWLQQPRGCRRAIPASFSPHSRPR